MTGVCFYRAYEIPYVRVDISVEEFARPRTTEEQATFDLYQRAWGHFIPEGQARQEKDEPEHVQVGIPTALTPDELAWVEANGKTLEAALRTSVHLRHRCRSGYDARWQRILFTVIPWERARAARLVNRLAKHDLQELEGWEDAMPSNTDFTRSSTVTPPVEQWVTTTPTAFAALRRAQLTSLPAAGSLRGEGDTVCRGPLRRAGMIEAA